VIDPQVRSIDIMPTLLDILDLEAPAGVEGRSLAGLIHGRDTEPLVAISQQDTSDLIPPTSIRTDMHKLILRPAVLANQAQHFQWFRLYAGFTWSSAQLVLPIASVDEGGRVKILLNGEPRTTVAVTTDRRNIELNLPGRVENQITVVALTPCRDAVQAGVDADEDCVSFRLFNPYEFYRLDRDPGEQENLYEDPAHSRKIAELRSQLARQLAGASATTGRQEVELDEETKARLRALGYIR
jgi:hypothetical protein